MLNSSINRSIGDYLSALSSGLGKVVVFEINKDDLEKIKNDISFLKSKDINLYVECFFDNLDSSVFQTLSEYIEKDKIDFLKIESAKSQFKQLIIIHCEQKFVLNYFELNNNSDENNINEYMYHLFVGEAKNSGIRISCAEIDKDQQEYMNKFDNIHNCFIDCKSKSSKFDLSINNIKLLDQIKVDVENMRSINRSFFYFISEINNPFNVIFSFEDIIQNRSKVSGPRFIISTNYFSKSECDVFFEDYVKARYSRERYYTTFKTTERIKLYLPLNS